MRTRATLFILAASAFLPASFLSSGLAQVQLRYSTYLGGTGWDQARAIAAGTDGAAYVAGETEALDFPTENPYQAFLGGGSSRDAFVSKLSSTGSALLYSTYLGGSGPDSAYGVAVENGCAYVAGYTYSADFPTSNPYQAGHGGTPGSDPDGFVGKLSSTGSFLLYSTYLGGSSLEIASGVAVEEGCVYAAGYTYSGDFPTVNPYQAGHGGTPGSDPDGFIGKLSSTGSLLLYSTYLGGAGGDLVYGVSVSQESAYAAGETASADFPTANPYQASNSGTDGFIAKFSASGSELLYSTYLGGGLGDSAASVSVDSSGEAYVTGHTGSTDFPTENPYQPSHNGGGLPAYDAFVGKLSSTGSFLLYSTYLGGSNDEQGAGISVQDKKACLAGYTLSSNFPTINPYQSSRGGAEDVFVTRISSAGSELLFSTFLGGVGQDRGFAVAALNHSAYVAGYTFSEDFPTANPYQGVSTDVPSQMDPFVARLYLPTPTPTPSATPTPSVTPTPTPSATPTPFVTPTTTPSATPSAAPTPSITPSPTPAPTATPSVTPTPTGSITPAPSPTPSVTPTSPASPSPSPPSSPTPSATPIHTPEFPVLESGDYDGDGRTDIAVFRPATGLWAVRGLGRVYYGAPGDIPASGDYAGDGTADVAVFRPATGLWAVKGVSRAYFGLPVDCPAPADYDGDGTCEIALFRGGSGLWAVRGLTRLYYGASTDRPVPGDYDGDGTADVAVFRPAAGLWAVRNVTRAYFGGVGDVAVPGVYGGGGTAGIAVFRSASGLWAVSGLTRCYYGGAGDTPVPGDYGGDYLDDFGVFRPATGLWAIKGISRVYYGTNGDIPVSR